MARIRGKAKSYEELFYSETIKEMLDNIEKEVKTDTGGTSGAIPSSVRELIRLIRAAKSEDEACIIFMIYINNRMTAIRMAIQKRTVAIFCKVYDYPISKFYELLAKKHRKAGNNAQKLPIRQSIYNS